MSKDITCTKTFNWNLKDGRTRVFRPGMLINDADAANWAIENRYGEARGKQIDQKAINSAERNKALKAAPKNKVEPTAETSTN